MPLVIVTAKRGLLDDEKSKALGEHLTQVVAQAFSTADESGKLKPDEIEVRFQDVSPRTINASPFAIEIFANDYPERRADIDDRVAKIAREVRLHPSVPSSVIDDKGGFVWALLGVGGFEKL